MLRLNRKGQPTLEYVLLIICTVAAFIALQRYISYSVIGRGRGAADNIGEAFSKDSTYNITTTSSSSSHETVDGGTTSSDVTESSTRSGTEHIQ